MKETEHNSLKEDFSNCRKTQELDRSQEANRQDIITSTPKDNLGSESKYVNLFSTECDEKDDNMSLLHLIDELA